MGRSIFGSQKAFPLLTHLYTNFKVIFVPLHHNVMYHPLHMHSLLPALNTLLDKSPSLGVRLAAGQAVALLFELVREADESFIGHEG